MSSGETSHDIGVATRGATGRRICDPPGTCPNCVQASALAAELTEDQLRTLFDVLEIRRLSKDEILITQGEYDDHLYAIARGDFAISRRGNAGREVVLHHLGPGNITGKPP